MIKKIKGNIFNTSCQVLVNTVNWVGVMGKGIALECKLRFPDMFEKYKEFCEKKLIKYYNKYGWVKLNKKKIRVMDGKFNKNGMIFNCKKRNAQGFFSFWLH